MLAAALGLALAVASSPAWARGKISFSSSGGSSDRMMFKASGVPATAMALDSEGLHVSLSNLTGVVFSETLTAGSLMANAAGTRWRYSAPRDGGIYDVVVATKLRADGTTGYSAKVRLQADLAAADPARSGVAVELLAPMVVAVSVGGDTLSAAATWELFRAAWRTRVDDFATRYFGPAKRVFVTSGCHLGSLGGLGGADAACQSSADAAGLGAVFTAWIADAHDGPSIRIPHASMPYVLTDGSVVARDWDDLVDGAIATPINLDETGAAASGDCGARVWTNTSVIGTPAVSDALEFACYEWTLSLFSRWGLVGDATATDATWTDGGGFGLQRCSSSARLYCFER